MALLASAWLLPVTGCYEAHDGPPGAFRRDGGPAQMIDAAAVDAAARDADADSSADGARSDGGRSDAGNAACGDLVPLYEGTGCSDATRTCIASCAATDPGCTDECIALDAECSFCVNQTFVRCANESGCQDAWDTFACCAREEPACATFAGLELLACAAGCDGELVDYDACFRALGGSCITEVVSRCGL